MFAYLPVREKLFSEDHGSYTTFGISALKERGGQYEEIDFVSDVSLDILTVLKIVYKCTEEQLEPIHLYEVIEDTLSSDCNMSV